MTLHTKFHGCFKVQGHEEIYSIFVKINTLMLKHFIINLLPKLQRVKYEQSKAFDEVMEVIKKEETWKRFCGQLCNPWPKLFNLQLNLNYKSISR